MKKIINAPETVVNEMLDGLVAANPEKLDIIPEKRIILRKEKKAAGKVAVLTGSGSGHEPDQVFYVGKGMMDAACAGPVFAAPTADAIYEGDEGRRKRRRSALHDQELHRRQGPVRHGGGNGPRWTGSP